jgi:superfamily II DNA or RNA helicase
MTLEEYYQIHGSKITQDSERLFVDEFLYPLVGAGIASITPQHAFLDSTGRSRRIDFACSGSKAPLALEVNGETYHAEGIIPNEMFDDNLFRQNEILRAGYRLVRFSYSQLKDPRWRPVVMASLRDVINDAAPELLSQYVLKPTEVQKEALDALDFYRRVKRWRKGIVVMPTGTGKTILSAIDAQRIGGKALFLVHRLDILAQSVSAYRMVWPTMVHGYLTGEARSKELEADVLFASKDTLRQPNELAKFARDHFSYVVIDEVHHGQSPSYRDILEYFTPKFMLGMTATPDRLDRKDIFELFDYNKAYEITVTEVIERGLLVPYTYYGLTDDIDYSKIRYEKNHYNVADLERHLIIPERNAAVLKEFLEKGAGDKAIGFCVSIKHAERMAAFFNEQGVPAAAIHSQAPDRDKLVQDFRDNKLTVAFTVDLFNEGVDFPNVQVLLFLRPTESKTVFIQQLGRGLRISPGKERVRILDFIGNYKRASLIRGYLAKDKREITTKEDGKSRRKFEYEYSSGCEVHFDSNVEEILNRQAQYSTQLDKALS